MVADHESTWVEFFFGGREIIATVHARGGAAAGFSEGGNEGENYLRDSLYECIIHPQY